MLKFVFHQWIIIASACTLLFSCDFRKGKKPPSANKLKERILFHINHADYSEAVVVCDSVINIHGKNNWVLTFKAVSYYHLSLYKSSHYCLQQAISLDSTNYETYYWLGNANKVLGDTLGAIYAYSKAISLNNLCAICYNNRGNLYQYRNNFDSALNDFNQAVNLDSNFLLAWSNLGKAYSSRNNFDSSLFCINKGISISPTGFLYHGRGSMYYLQKKYDSAVSDFTIAIMYESDNPTYYLNRAFAYAELNRKTAMCEDLKSSWNLGNEEARRYYLSACELK